VSIAQWTQPYFGVQHYPSKAPVASSIWATVTDLGLCATCLIHIPGSSAPNQTTHESADAARRHAERTVTALRGQGG